MTTETLGACQCHEKHAPTYWKGVVREYKDALEKAESRPLAPDAITNEMVERGQDAYWGNERTVEGRVRAILTAALTEPPARPEGAEKVEAVLHQYWSGDIDGDDLADRIAEEMNR